MKKLVKVTLVDAKEFSGIVGKQLNEVQHSYNMNKKNIATWSNGWCPVSKFKATSNGLFFGRIANELVPCGIYNNIEVESQLNI